MKKIEITMQEIWQATKPVIFKNKKKYTRKSKHKRDEKVQKGTKKNIRGSYRPL